MCLRRWRFKKRNGLEQSGRQRDRRVGHAGTDEVVAKECGDDDVLYGDVRQQGVAFSISFRLTKRSLRKQGS